MVWVEFICCLFCFAAYFYTVYLNEQLQEAKRDLRFKTSIFNALTETSLELFQLQTNPSADVKRHREALRNNLHRPVSKPKKKN